MKKSEVLELIEKCEPSYGQLCRERITAKEHIGGLMYMAAYDVYENIKQAVLEYEDSEAGAWEKHGDNATICSKCGKGLQDSHGYGFVLSYFAYCPFCGREMKARSEDEKG